MENRQFALIGHPLGHSVSPAIHQKLFDLSGRKGTYTLLPIAPEDFLSQTAKDQRDMLRGYNVTIPYKVTMLNQLDAIDPDAKRYGAINVVDNRDGVRTGYNTDVFGFLQTLKSHGVALHDAKVCVVGAGGVGRMFAMEAALAGAKVTIAVRKQSLSKAEALAEHIESFSPVYSAKIADTEALPGGWDLIINATSCGMYPHTQEMPIGQAALIETKHLFDCIYNPGKTLLMRCAEKVGCHAFGGMDMLVWQAVQAHTIWDGDTYPAEQIDLLIAEMRRHIEKSFLLQEETR